MLGRVPVDANDISLVLTNHHAHEYSYLDRARLAAISFIRKNGGGHIIETHHSKSRGNVTSRSVGFQIAEILIGKQVGQRQAVSSSFHTNVMDVHQFAGSDGHLLDHFHSMLFGKALSAPQALGQEALLVRGRAVINAWREWLGIEQNPCNQFLDVHVKLKRILVWCNKKGVDRQWA